MTVRSTVTAVVPAGQLARNPQPVLDLENGWELRPWRASDAGSLLEAGADHGIRRWNLLPVPNLQAAHARIERMHDRWHAETAAIGAIAHPQDPAAGLIGWNDIDLDGGSAEIVYWLLPAARGAGVAVTATKRVSQWAFDQLGLHRRRLCHSVANPASCRVAEGRVRPGGHHAQRATA